MQTVYPYARGRLADWGDGKDMRLTEQHHIYATKDASLQVYAEWRQFWNVSKPVLVEKSPRHMLMTRLLLHWFTPERTSFLVILRHPLATMHYKWEAENQRFAVDCCEKEIRHWLKCHKALFEDVPPLRNVTVVQFEWLAAEKSQGF